MYALALAARLSLSDYVAGYPPRVYLATTLPRAVLQVAFLTYLGYYAGSVAGREFAFIGACAQVIVIATVVRGADVLLDDRFQDTIHRLRLGVLSLPAVIAARWWVYIAEGTAEALVAAAVVGPLLGEADELGRLFAAAPLFLLVAVTTSALGLTAAALSLTQRADVLITNLLGYLTVVACGVVAPLSSLGPVGSEVARALPLTNGLLAIRDVVGGGAWLGDAALEAGVGAAWLAVGVLLLELQTRRSRRLGTDEQL